jgi:hypothetical protein
LPKFEILARASDSSAIAVLKHSGQRQSFSAAATKETCGNSSHQQLLFPATDPQVKLAPQFEQSFDLD